MRAVYAMIGSKSRHALLAGALVGSLACSGAELVVECADAKGHHVVCGFQNPEDLALLDDGRTVVLSQFGDMEGTIAGSLAIFDLESETLRVAYEGGQGQAATPGWGDLDCVTSPPDPFSPHGIYVANRPDGRLRMLVVNHGGRETIEMFEITGRGEDTKIEWRGCALTPEGAFLNSVAALPDGGFVTTHMMNRDSQALDNLRMLFGKDTGFVYEWQSGRGMQKLAGTDGPFPNGIEASPDGRVIYINLYSAGEVWKVSRETGERLATAEVARPDNVKWGQDGRLLVASHVAPSTDFMSCQPGIEGACGVAFEIVAVDPETMERTVVFRNEGAPMGGATVAIDIGGGELLMGSFAGDRVLRGKRMEEGRGAEGHSK